MGKDKKVLSINELRVGMVTSKEIKSGGRTLLAAGVTITEEILNKLKNAYFFSQMEVYFDTEDPVAAELLSSKYSNKKTLKTNPSQINYLENSDNEKIKTMAQVNKTFIEFSIEIQNLFYNMEYLQSANINEVRKFAARIQQELQYTSSIIRNIVLTGSGSDSIYRHGVNVAALSTIIGKWIGLSEQDINLLTYASVLHDFGKTKIDKAILDKPSGLTCREFDLIKQHPIIAYNYIKQIKFLDKAVSFGVLMHHEKTDGSGYPLGLKGDDIHQFAKIIAIADVFDAVNSDRNHKRSRGPFEALEIIRRESMTGLDYELCNVFLKNVVNYYVGENVLLSDGSICKIVQIDINDIGRPLLLNGDDFIDLKKESSLYVEALKL